MLEAISMYLGGDIIKSEDAGYHTSKELGLRCPACGEPVIYCAGSSHAKTEKRKAYVTPPYFSHYAKNLSNSACEFRMSTDPKVRARIQREASQGKKQRLDLYNKRLWDLFVYSLELESSQEKLKAKFIKQYTRANLIKFAKQMRSLWHQYLESLKDDILLILEQSLGYVETDLYHAIATNNSDAEFLSVILDYKQDETKIALNKKVCLEVAIFLSTHSSVLFWKEFITYYMLTEMEMKKLTLDKLCTMKIDTFPVGKTLCAYIAHIRWVDAIAETLKNENMTTRKDHNSRSKSKRN